MTDFHEVVATSSVIVCVGSGGVGKTTTSAVLGIQAALLGRRTLVLTIDPARRLANSLGVDALGHAHVAIDLSSIGGSSTLLHAAMLDMKTAFDELVERHAPDPGTREKILENRFYRYFSTSLAGAQELSAAERLLEVVNSGEWDLIVLDTPPTTNALDFLDAPMRFHEALDGTVIELMSNSAEGRGGRMLRGGGQFVTRTLTRFTGSELFEELGVFLQHFAGLFDGFRERTRDTARLFSSPKTRFIVISSPNPDTLGEARFFREKLELLGVSLGAIVINRVHRPFSSNRFAGESPNALADALEGVPGAGRFGRVDLLRLARRLLENAHEFDRVAEREHRDVGALRESLGDGVPLVTVPLFARDVHSIDSLEEMRQALFTGSGLPATVPQATE